MIGFGVSPDDQYLAAYYGISAVIRVYNLSDWSLVREINLARATSCLVWSFDNQYLIMFPANVNYLLVYDRLANWSLSHNVSIGYSNIVKCIPQL
jgi:hypothetical protein